MALSNSDWSRTPIPRFKTLSKTLIPITNPNFLSIPPTNRRFLFIVSSQSLPPLLEDASNELKISEFRPNFPNLQQSSPSDSTNFNEFICDLCKNPQTEAFAFECYQKAKDQPDFQSDPLMLKFLIRYLLRSRQWSSISVLSEDFRVFRVFPDKSTCCRLVASCVRARKFKITEILLGIFESEREIAIPVFDSVMGSYNKLHMYGKTISVFERMRVVGILPDSGCYCRVMEAYRRIGEPEKVLVTFIEFESRKLDSIKFSSRIYWILCDSLGKSGRALEALKFFKEMVGKGISYASSFYSSLICSFASIREVKLAEDLFDEAREKGMVQDPVIFLRLVLMYVEEGMIEKTLEIVKLMKDMKIRCTDCIFCTVVNGYVKKRGLRETIRVYEELISIGFEPGQVTYASMINVYCRLGLYAEAEMVFFEMQAKGFDKCVVAYGNMVSMYGKVGRLRDAMRLVAKMKEKGCEPNVWVYNSLIDMHGRALNLRQVEKVWKEMKRRRVAPDKISYTSIINAYSKGKEFEECMRFYQEYRMNGGKIDRTMAGIMVGVFSKCSMINELVKLLQDMKSEGTGLDERLYNSGKNALRDTGLHDQVKWFEESFGIEKAI
ncbi:pentatricopeptide repeat (PPR-like) superfamily protein [Tasmannia lanceolata]|uniref:pentatricopeptide repeat (PPR-like) superfamily protein n=1 Tax=Tasmannia lanceolata TaxID=3420 RepID=UPI0040633600